VFGTGRAGAELEVEASTVEVPGAGIEYRLEEVEMDDVDVEVAVVVVTGGVVTGDVEEEEEEEEDDDVVVGVLATEDDEDVAPRARAAAQAPRAASPTRRDRALRARTRLTRTSRRCVER
jgi:hypothetical protein